MIRHMNSMHAEAEDATERSDSETSHMEDDDGTNTDDQETPEYDPWESVVEKAFERCQEHFEEEVEKLIKTRHLGIDDAREEAYEDMRSTYRKAIMDIFTKRMVWFHAMQKHPLYKAVKKTVDDLINMEDFGRDEAWKYAVKKRKYLFDAILDDYNPPEAGEEDASDEEAEQEEEESEPVTKIAKM